MLGSPVTGLHVNITPETSASTIACTVTPIAGRSAERPEPRPVTDRRRAVQARPAVPDRGADVPHPAHPEIRLLLPGERRVAGCPPPARWIARPRTAISPSSAASSRDRSATSAATASGTGAERRSAGFGSASPARPAAAMNAENAVVVRANPGGTGIPAPAAPRGWRSCHRSAVHRRRPAPPARVYVDSGLVIRLIIADQRHHAGGAVDADHLPGPDLRRGASGADDRGQPILPADDRGVGHDPADIGDRPPDLGEDRGPGRRGAAADQDLAVAHVGDLADRARPPAPPLRSCPARPPHR